MGQKNCPIQRAANVLEGKWTMLILRELLSGTKRFGELRAEILGVSPKTLTERLRILEDQAIISRKVYPEIPPRVEYSLTELGEKVRPIIEALSVWGINLPLPSEGERFSA